MTTGEKIRRLRRREGLSQEQLAEALGITRQAVSRWENDQALPETAVLLKLSERFRVSVDFLLKRDVAEESANPPIMEGAKPRVPIRLIAGLACMGFALLALVAVALVSCAVPWMKEGTGGLMDPAFWSGNALWPVAGIIALALLTGIWQLVRYWLFDSE